MKDVTMHVRSLGCSEVVTFRVIPDFDLDLGAVVDRVRERITSTYTAIEGVRVVGEQGAVFWEFRLPYHNYEKRKEILLSELGVIEHEVAEAMRIKKTLELLRD